MNCKSIRTVMLASGVAVAAGALPGICRAQSGEVLIYKGETLQQGPVHASSWGSGEVKAASDYVFTGSDSIKVTTHGRYQGARFSLVSPVDLKSVQGEQSAYLQFIYMIPDKAGAGRLGGDPSSMSSYMSSMSKSGRGGGAGGYGGGKMSGMGGPGGAGAATATTKPKPLANFRLVFATTDNKMTEMQVPLENARPERESWHSFAIPVAAIPGLKDTSGQVKEIRFFGDSPTVIYIGEVRVLRDETPIRVDDLDDKTIAKNDSETFTASAEAGPTPLKYDWTIQGVAAKDNDPQEVTSAYLVVGEGKTFKHKFVKGGDYVVTLVVTDAYGLKKPATKKMNMHVTL